MASKKPAKPTWGPHWPHVDAESTLAKEADRKRIQDVLRDLGVSPLFARVVRQVRAERGLWMREGHSWPEALRKKAENALVIAECLEELARQDTLLDVPGTPAEWVEGYRKRWFLLLQAMLDHVRIEANDPSMQGLVGLAGLVGRCDDLAALDASSGLEAANRLAWCLRRAVFKWHENPLWPYMVSAAQRRAMRKQVNRDRPNSSAELQPDDIAILQACVDGPLQAKLLAARCMVDGRALSESHVSKRKKDLKKWSLLKRARPFEIADLGRTWLAELQALAKR